MSATTRRPPPPHQRQRPQRHGEEVQHGRALDDVLGEPRPEHFDDADDEEPESDEQVERRAGKSGLHGGQNLDALAAADIGQGLTRRSGRAVR